MNSPTVEPSSWMRLEIFQRRPIEKELANLERIIEIGNIFGTKNIRIFSFYPPDISTNAHYDQYVPEVIDRLGKLTEKAASAGFYLLHENEKEIVGDTPERCHALISGVNSSHLRFIWETHLKGKSHFYLKNLLHKILQEWNCLCKLE